MMSNIRIIIPVEQSNVNEQLYVRVGKDLWDVHIGANRIAIKSRNQYKVPKSSDDDYLEQDQKIDSLIHKVVAHVRNTVYMSFGLSMQWGYEAFYGSTHSLDTLNLFPSIHQSGTSTTFSPEALVIDKEIFIDLGMVKDDKVRAMMSYWRRAEELSDLSFQAEAFLNFFKILEGIGNLEENKPVANALIDRFAPIKGTGKKRVPMPTIRKHIGKFISDDSLVGRIKKVAYIFSSANFPVTVKTPLFIFLLDLVHIRNHYNVAHQLLRVNKYDSFRGIGQHSDEFSHTLPNLGNIKMVAKRMILNYAYPNKYQYNSIEQAWELK